jgi:hypothetical protein
MKIALKKTTETTAALTTNLDELLIREQIFIFDAPGFK